MKKFYYVIVMCGLFLLVGCGNKASGDKVLYKDVKSSFMSKINSYDNEKRDEIKKEYGLDKESIDDMPLALYNVKGRYVAVIQEDTGEYEYFYYSSKKKEIITKLEQGTFNVNLDGLTPVYTQNNFKLAENN